jgi:hypothetical protein
MICEICKTRIYFAYIDNGHKKLCSRTEEECMSKLGNDQRNFAKFFPLLLMYAHLKGYQVTFPKEHENHIEGSFHFDGRAKDINLFKGGRYLTETEDHLLLGLFWEFLGGTWGGRFEDGNHYSWGEKR